MGRLSGWDEEHARQSKLHTGTFGQHEMPVMRRVKRAPQNAQFSGILCYSSHTSSISPMVTVSPGCTPASRSASVMPIRRSAR